ncbi:MAG: alpha/beta hydrolase [Chitinophagaceae bacterium]
MKPLYCISGMGADERVFNNLQVRGFEIHFIKWIIPGKNEHISEYAKRLGSQIHHKNPVLIGLSFGGMMCIEMAKQFDIQKIIIISSIKSRAELPSWMRIAGKLKLNKVLPLRSTRLTEPIQNYTLGVETEEEKLIAREYRQGINRVYSNWAIDQIINWKNEDCPVPLYHIHGAHDRIFPAKKVKADCIIPTGGHFMIMNRIDQINTKISEILNIF